MVTITADLMQSRTGYGDTYITNTNLEYLIDDAIDYVNLEAGTSISNLAASTVTVTASQAAVLIPLIKLLMRAYKDKGPTSNISSMSVSAVINDPQYKLNMYLLKKGIDRLRGRSFERV